ncbi:hypothetical protein [Herpetosiphon gulosus]|uniref:Integral membrane protein n=1 Tax=Herpetosiphon gulosus TaxID=1973496 RepID=A0ABP9X5W3_9CHLR
MTRIDPLTVRYLSIPLMLLCFIYPLYRRYRRGEQGTLYLIAPVIIGTILMVISTIAAVPKPVTWMNHGIRVATMHTSMLYFYLMAERLTQRTVPIDLRTHPIIWGTLTITCIGFIIDTQRVDNLGMLMDNDSIQITFAYITSHILSYSLMLTLSAGLMYRWWQCFQQFAALEIKIRALFCIIGFTCSSVMALSVIVVSILVFVDGEGYRQWLAWSYHGVKPATILFLILSFGIPQAVYRRCIPQWLRQQYEQYQLHEIKRVHRVLMAMTPQVRRAVDILANNRTRLMIDIIDSRDLILSHAPKPCDGAVEEMYWILTIYPEAPIQASGPATPALNTHPIDYIMQFARVIRRWQRQQSMIPHT